jgi:hypothetical protein
MAGEFNINWFEIAVPNSTGDLMLKGSLKVYPNPGYGKFTVSGSIEKSSVVTLSVCNLAGNELMATEFNSGTEFEESIDLSGIGKGVFLLKVNSASGSAFSKIVIL